MWGFLSSLPLSPSWTSGVLKRTALPWKGREKADGSDFSRLWVGTTLSFSSFRGGRGKGRRRERDPVQVCARPLWFLEAALWDGATPLWGPC